MFWFVWFFVLWGFLFIFAFLLGSLGLDSSTDQLSLFIMYKARYVPKQYDLGINMRHKFFFLNILHNMSF